MSAAADFYVIGDSWLHRADPRVKLLFVICCGLLLILFDNLWIMLLALIALLLLHRSAGIAAEKLFQVFKALIVVILLMVILRALFYPVGQDWWALGPVRITPAGLAGGMVLGSRILTMAYAVFLWLYTTKTNEIVVGLVHWRVPYTWSYALALALRFIPTLQASLQSITQAQRARGLDLERGGAAGRIRRWMPIFVSMVIGSLRSSDQLAKALEARGFDAPGVQRTYLRQIRYTLLDWGYTILILGLSTILFWANIAYDFGEDPLRLVL
jgi:energy-coupling factor transport system permease protein